MIKTLTNLLKQDKEKFVVPKGVQDCIPITAIYDDGIFRVGKDKYSKSFKFTDINYAVASREDKEAMFLEYSELLNSLDSGATTKMTINNRRLNRLDFEKTILIPEAGDDLDVYREEYNKMLLDKATGANAIVQDKYVTISINKKSVEDARTYFARVGADLIAHFSRLGSKCVELETDERLRIVHDFFRVGEETAYHFDIKETRKKGHDFKDYVCPDTMEFEKDYFKMGDRYGRVLFLREYASYIKDTMVTDLTDLNRNLMMSIDIVPVPTDEAVREAESRLLGVETNITNWQRKQNQNNNFSATVPYDMEQQKKEMKEFLDDLTTRDQRMMFAVLTLVHTADSKKQLDDDTEALLTVARQNLCQFAVLKYQQPDGLNTAMPFGTRKIDAFRTLTTESLAVFIPFKVQDIYHENGIYYGQNVISKNMIIADRRQLLNGNSFILGVSGGGKSFAAKGEIENIILSSDADVIIIDPEREYSQLVKALGGEIINISATSQSHINAMDMNKEYGDGANPVILKSEFIMSLCEQLIGGTNLGAKQKSIIDRCTASVYRDYQQRGYTGTVPTLQDFRAELLKQDEPEAKEIALAIELFTNGSLNTFAKPTNVDTHNRLICYDILDLGKQLMPIGMLVVLDSILNRITQNRAKGKQTFIFIDEIYLLFQHEYSANFLFTLWKRVRKYGAYATGITQNVDDLLQSHTARTMLANSEFLIMLNQASTDRLELAKLLNISDRQLSYITNVDAGHGLIKVGSSLVPFANKFPKNTKLYKLMTTKPGEGASPLPHFLLRKETLMKNRIYIALICAFSILLAVSSGFLIKHYIDSEKQSELYDNLIETIEKTDTEKDTMTYSQDKSFLSDYQDLYLQNNDMVGWIKIEDTKINYPVMQSKDNPNFYLKHGFDKAYTDYGCPYIQENCDVDIPSDNLIIYGHNMKDSSMFSGLMKYTDKSFWESHKTISFDTLTEKCDYEIIAAFKTVVYTDSPESFKYYQFVNADTADEFNAYITKCKELALYDTGVTAEYGDKLITLSTCEYSRNNGRMVVVAKKMAE